MISIGRDNLRDSREDVTSAVGRRAGGRGDHEAERETHRLPLVGDQVFGHVEERFGRHGDRALRRTVADAFAVRAIPGRTPAHASGLAAAAGRSLLEVRHQRRALLGLGAGGAGVRHVAKLGR